MSKVVEISPTTRHEGHSKLVLKVDEQGIIERGDWVSITPVRGVEKLAIGKKMEIGKGKFTVYTERGGISAIPLKVTHKYEQPGCHVCLDYVANLADVSCGSVGSPDGWSTVFVRTKAGDSLWAKAMAAGCFDTRPMEKVKPGLELTTKLATEKITKHQKVLDERKVMGVNKGLRSPYL